MSTTIKKYVTLLLALFAFASMTPSCQTVKETNAKIEKAAKDPETKNKLILLSATFSEGSKFGVKTLLRKNPDTRDILNKVSVALDIAVADGKVKPAQLREILQNSYEKSKFAAEIDGALSLALLTYDRFYAVNVKGEVVPESVKIIAESLNNGIKLGLASVSNDVGGSDPLKGKTDEDLTL